LFTVSGQWERGLKLLTKGHALNAQNAGGWYHAALFYDYYRQGKYREALEIMKLHPTQDIVENQQKYVAVYAELGDIESAKKHWNKCVELNPNWSANRLAEIGRLWNFPKDYWARYMQSIAKAGYKVTQ
jgi:tetratricopeptide (TPR) repeat protein